MARLVSSARNDATTKAAIISIPLILDPIRIIMNSASKKPNPKRLFVAVLVQFNNPVIEDVFVGKVIFVIK
jgi:hypothetical protein